MQKMKALTKFQSICFIIGGLLMVVGAGLYAFMLYQKMACWLFLVGAVIFAVMQMAQVYEGRELTLVRLKKIQTLADVLFIVSGLLMVDSAYKLLAPLFMNADGTGYLSYINYVYNKWVIVLLIAAILEIYTTHRISHELDKTKNT